MRSPIQNHVGEKFGLVHLTGLGTGDSDPDRDFMLNQIGQVIIWTVSGNRFTGQVSAGIGPFDAVVDKKNIHLMSLGMRYFPKLETTGRLFHLILAQDKQKISHHFFLL
jgi:hypothetical protein